MLLQQGKRAIDAHGMVAHASQGRRAGRGLMWMAAERYGSQARMGNRTPGLLITSELLYP